MSNRNATTVEVLQDILDAMLDPINQLFFHSHMLRAWATQSSRSKQRMDRENAPCSAARDYAK